MTTPSPYVSKRLFLWALLFCSLPIAQYFIFMHAPVEQSMGMVQKIIYTHMPVAWWGLFSFFLVFVASIAFLYTKKRFWDTLAGAAAEVGLVMATLALITGSIWAKHSWGIWWTWDPRLTTTLVMWFIYVGYLLLRGLDIPLERRATISAVVGIVAFLDVPLVFVSARLWRSIHPPKTEFEPAMLTTLLVCLFALGAFWAALLTLRYGIGRDTERIATLLIEDATA